MRSSSDAFDDAWLRVLYDRMLDEAAGEAVALACAGRRPVAEIDGGDVRARLGYLDEPLGF